MTAQHFLSTLVEKGNLLVTEESSSAVTVSYSINIRVNKNYGVLADVAVTVIGMTVVSTSAQ